MELADCVRGALHTQYLSFAIKLELFEALSRHSSGASVQQLAADLAADVQVVESLAQVLVAMNILSEREGVFSMIETHSKFLLKTSPEFIGFGIERVLKQEFPSLEDGIHRFLSHRTCEPTLENLPVRELNEKDEKLLRHAVIESGPFMSAVAHASGRELSDKKIFNESQCAVDLGGNDGSFLIPILLKNPKLEGVIVDLPQLQSRAEANIRAAGLESRCRFLAQNFFTGDFPEADLYFCGFVLHDWNKTVCFYLLKKIHRALEAGGQLVLHENLIDDPTKKIINWGTQLLFLLKRRVCPIVRSSSTYQKWLKETGFLPGEVVFGTQKSFVFAFKGES